MASRMVETWRSRRSRRLFMALLVGLALVVAACGVGPQTGAGPTATPKPTATPAPVPCATWRIVSSPNSTQYRHSSFAAVSALSPAAAWAVGGAFGDGGPAATLIEQWDGAAWHVIPSPGAYRLNGVVALSLTDVWAVGSQGESEGDISRVTTLIEHWNGTQWSVIPSANPSARLNVLNGVAAVAANDVWAVGAYATADGNGTVPLIERWDGSAWRVVASPPLAEHGQSALYGAARIPDTNQLWVVGYSMEQALIERWDGSAWHLLPISGLRGGQFLSGLSGAVALSATDAWAVGGVHTLSNDAVIQPLIVHWNGSMWYVASTPDVRGVLSSVAAASSNDVRAVGQSASGVVPESALIEQWDGTTWRVIASPISRDATYSNLSGVTTDDADNYWAVGTIVYPASPSRTLIAHCP